MKNANMRVRDGVLIIRVPLVEGELSSTGKSTIIAQNEGMFERLDDVDEALEGCSIKLMVLGPKPKSKSAERAPIAYPGPGPRGRERAQRDDTPDDTIQRRPNRPTNTRNARR